MNAFFEVAEADGLITAFVVFETAAGLCSYTVCTLSSDDDNGL